MAANADKAALEKIGDSYRAAYVAHDPARAPISPRVRFSENNAEMTFPDASWDTVGREIGPALTCSDPSTGNVGIYTSIMMLDTPGFLAIRLEVEGGAIVEIEHMLSTKRNLSGPPTPFADPQGFTHDPDLSRTLAPSERVPRADMIRQADGYFSTLENNTGELRGARFTPDCVRHENGMKFANVEQGFRLGIYRFNARLRDRDYFLIDEDRGLVMGRAFIDHKGVLDKYRLTDGTERSSVFREPHSWSVLELFKIKNGVIAGIEATFIAVPYYLRSPWTKKA
jgi:hypothetical protein